MKTMRSVSISEKTCALLSGILRSRREMKTGVNSMNRCRSLILISINPIHLRQRKFSSNKTRLRWDGCPIFAFIKAHLHRPRYSPVAGVVTA